jgi:serine/threonine protein kinase
VQTFTDEKLISEGAQGQVWSAFDEHGRAVAVKRLTVSSDPAQQGVRLSRFRREVTCQSTLRHEAIVEVLYSSLDGDVPYYVMPLAEGTLRGMLVMNTDGLVIDECVRLFTAVVEGMAYAHSQQIIHRDLKPENILIFSGAPRISDFGIGRRLDGGSVSLTVAGAAMGTPSYMAPEQFRDSHSVEASADVFALGFIFYELVTGRPAANGIDYTLVPPRFNYMLRMATQDHSSQRFQSAVELLLELAIAAGDPSNKEPAEELTALFDGVMQGDDRAEDLYRVLSAHAGDLDLYINTLASAPELVVRCLAARPADFDWLIRAFDRHANGEFPSNAVDRIAYFLWTVTKASCDDAVRLLALERTLVLAYQHERLYARDRFVDELSVALNTPSLVTPAGQVILRHRAALPFIRAGVLELDLPTEMVNVLG